MAMSDIAIPTLPSRNIEETVAFYEPPGFKLVFRVPDPEGYAILRLGSLEVHFYLWPDLDPAKNYCGCYLRVSDVDSVYRAFASSVLPARGIPSLGGIESKFFDMREFRLVDPSGNLLRIGEEVKRISPRSSRTTLEIRDL